MVAIYPRNQTVLEGRPTQMNCSAKGNPRPVLSWTSGNGELPPDAAISNYFYQSILRLFKTSKSMEGWYTCKAENKAGVAFTNSFLHVLGWFYFITKRLAAISLVLALRVFYHLYLDKRFKSTNQVRLLNCAITSNYFQSEHLLSV